MDIKRIKDNIIEDSNGCWNWNKSITSAGYGQFMEDCKRWTSHRYSYTCVFGEIPKGKVIRHKCHNTKCCNPYHLEVGTHKDNWHDSETNHRESDAKKRKNWIIDGVVYNTCREAVEKTGISMNSIIKYTDRVSRVFDIEAYRNGCNSCGICSKI